ncbi:hypothetical protein NC653_010220 [Populus alba x Populus x berolinensis]|uniref:Uncharacterized protein n=1 Tax=Populus alba x Populus x berolinensis TaxID=444605 RepID=A0AAD6QZ95_9ROSI|nr:hypothetical protein NC653_010220 [Populus alba x Populus x berolinensis]
MRTEKNRIVKINFYLCQIHEIYGCANSKAQYQQRDWRSQSTILSTYLNMHPNG